jgi:predicted double-glycine peptidase
MSILKLNRFLQDAGHCAVAATASVANYYDRKLDYQIAKKIAHTDGGGMYTPDIALLANALGFKKVTIVTAHLDSVDFKWQGLSRSKLCAEMKRAAKYHQDKELREVSSSYAKFLSSKECKNDLIIDMKFGDYIRSHLNNNKPVLASFNWNLFFNYPKWNEKGEVDPIRGAFEEHEVVIYGYNERGVFILDSHHQMYKGKLKKFANGRYTMNWETLMTVMGQGDLILPDNFEKDSLKSSI